MSPAPANGWPASANPPATGSTRSPSATERTPRTNPSACTANSSRAPASGNLALLRDLHDLYLMACESAISWTMIRQASQGARDHELLELAEDGETDTAGHIAWITTRMKEAAPQTLVVG